MPNILIRNLSEETLARLKARAKRHNRSTQAEVAEIIDRFVNTGSAELEAAIDDARRESAGAARPNAAEIIRADRER